MVRVVVCRGAMGKGLRVLSLIQPPLSQFAPDLRLYALSFTGCDKSTMALPKASLDSSGYVIITAPRTLSLAPRA